MSDKQSPNSKPWLFKAGRSGNPKGRPKSKHALSEAIRAGVDPAEMVERALAILRSDKTPPSVAIQMWTALADRGWARPPAERELAVTVSTTPTLPPDWQSLSPSERLAYLDRLRVDALPVLEIGDGDDYPDGYATREQELQLTEIAPEADELGHDTGSNENGNY